jgi:predicted NBD/HSP70 family sugar kinase
MSRVLAVDVGGSHVKCLASGQSAPRRFVSGPSLTADAMVERVRALARGWRYEVVSIGYPGPVLHGLPVREPRNLGTGWVGFDFTRAFGSPVKVINDAAMQALGSYQGGRMLFLGLGTGLGSALIVDGVLEAMELAHLPYRKGRTYEDYVGQRPRAPGQEELASRGARDHRALHAALAPDYVVLGGGNARRLKTLPDFVRRGDNADAFIGGFRLWDGTGTWTASAPVRAARPERGT